MSIFYKFRKISDNFTCAGGKISDNFTCVGGKISDFGAGGLCGWVAGGMYPH
ncbi:MAG: hypothetical protein LBQ31_09040 [Bacteroidales bacterium]|nr:hypothetical protein [Bacteroidales bacterium]